jgi:hypothetical protein
MNVNTNELPKNREIWASINGYLNYEVSWFGRVRNTKTGRILKCRVCSNGYAAVNLSKTGVVKTHFIHQLVAREWVGNPETKRCVDHIDGNRTNNHYENLRYATHSENARNKNKRANTTSMYYGVSWQKKSGKWRAQIQIEGKRKNLGFFTDEKQAAEVFNMAAQKHYKEFAKLNELD